jgi:3-hydroxyacyl-[acyl-carrier-protein] dehydratase/UDP-3-O-[3-hydroxymyristoyl] N-acetylglucosamine deacetylase/3-hydroxyacyl-[acyl-carrier-protein] dehydratase
MDIENILKILPHRYPFLLVDRILELEEGKRITTIKNVTYNEHFFQGHFPQKRVMPGVLIVEALAQTGGILIYFSIEDKKNKAFYLSKIENMKFRKLVLPGDQLVLEAYIDKLRKNFCLMHGIVSVEDEIVADGIMMAFITDFKDKDSAR